MSQTFVTPTFHIKQPGGMHEAVRRPTGDGVLDQIQDLLGSDPRFSANFGILVPPYYSPQGPRDPARSAGRTSKNRPSLLFRIQNRIQNFNRFLKAFWLLECLQKPPKIHSKSTQKSIKILIDCLIDF